MFEAVKEIYYVSWSDMRFMRHNMLNVILTSLMSPLLYLIAFGFGLGDSMTQQGVPYIAFMIPGIVALTSLSASFTSTSTRLNVQRLFYRSFDEMLMCPLRFSSIIIGKTMLGFMRGLLSCSIIFAIGLFLTPHLQLTPLFLACVLLSCFTFSCLGVTAALLAKSHQSMATFNTLVILPMTFLCGTFFSLDSLPEAFQWALYAVPLTHSSVCIRAASLGWDFPWASLAVLAIFTLVFFSVNMHLLRTRRV